MTPTKVLNDGIWDGAWSADVEPGNWILYATYDGDEGQFAAMTLLQAAVAEGGEADAMLSSASMLHVSTKWNDYDGVERTLADDSLIISGGQKQVVDLVIVIKWKKNYIFKILIGYQTGLIDIFLTRCQIFFLAFH